ncbi:50S ribosomal protein L9 [Candidatus Dependentiae bacterium Noda2021]|nr:50S ribosomal protein L9 [Candidatus Dependentiae bacterium Noda2021]
MKVFLLKDIEKVGMEGEIIKVSDGYAKNFLFPRKLAQEVTAQNESFFKNRIKQIEHRHEVIETKTSMLAEKIKSIKLTVARKMHDNGELYGKISANEIVEMLAEKGIPVAKNQVEFEKSIKSQGKHEVTIKLSSRLQPKLTLTVVPE